MGELIGESTLVSIVVAVYNVENLIERCIKSLLAQTYHNIEIILVDDGSTDGSSVICDRYSYGYPNIRTIHKKNGGVSSARQAGLDASVGDYVIHADPDDYVESDMIALMVKQALKTGADIVTCDFYSNDDVVRVQDVDKEKMLRLCVGCQCALCCWNSLIKRRFLTLHNIRFTPKWLSHSEDRLFIVRVLAAGAQIAHVAHPLYHYINRDGSLVTTRSIKSLQSVIAVIAEIEKLVGKSYSEELFYFKRYAVILAYFGRYFEYVNTMYPEIRMRLISAESNKPRYSLDAQLARCMKFPPAIVWLEAKIMQKIFGHNSLS